MLIDAYSHDGGAVVRTVSSQKKASGFASICLSSHNPKMCVRVRGRLETACRKLGSYTAMMNSCVSPGVL